MRGISNEECHSVLPRVEMSNIRGHRLKVKMGGDKDLQSRVFFTRSAIGAWNIMPREVVEADTTAMFPNSSADMNRQGIE